MRWMIIAVLLSVIGSASGQVVVVQQVTPAYAAGYEVGSAVGKALGKAFASLNANSQHKLMTKQRLCLEVVADKDFNGYTSNLSWCPQYIYDHPFVGVPWMTDEQLAEAQRTCELKKLNGKYRVRSPNLKENDKFSCIDLADAVHTGWNK